MADIAFLLLVFWLVATTMDRDLGLRVKLPKKPDKLQTRDDSPIRKRNILQIQLNAQDEVLIEGKRHPLDSVSRFVRDFYLSDDPNMPERTWVTTHSAADTLASLYALKEQLEAQTTSAEQLYQLGKIQMYIEEWEGYRESQKILGDYQVISKRAVIRFESNNGSSYEAYFSILDQINSVLKFQRNQLSEKLFGMSYDLMEARKDFDSSLHPKIRAIRHRFPMRLLEPTARGEM